MANTVFTDNFDSEPGDFANFMTSNPAAAPGDLIGPGSPLGLTASGSSVELDGPGPFGVQLVTTQGFFVAAGDVVTLRMMVSGNQVGADFATDDSFGAVFLFDTPQTIENALVSSVFVNTHFSSFPDINGVAFGGLVPWNTPWSIYTVSFTAGESGVLHAGFGSGSTDGHGPLIDDFALGIAVPEPTTWGLMIAGFGLIGGALRRRPASALSR
jgi:hypothetical protein